MACGQIGLKAPFVSKVAFEALAVCSGENPIGDDHFTDEPIKEK